MLIEFVHSRLMVPCKASALNHSPIQFIVWLMSSDKQIFARSKPTRHQSYPIGLTLRASNKEIIRDPKDIGNLECQLLQLSLGFQTINHKRDFVKIWYQLYRFRDTVQLPIKIKTKLSARRWKSKMKHPNKWPTGNILRWVRIFDGMIEIVDMPHPETQAIISSVSISILKFFIKLPSSQWCDVAGIALPNILREDGTFPVADLCCWPSNSSTSTPSLVMQASFSQTEDQLYKEYGALYINEADIQGVLLFSVKNKKIPPVQLQHSSLDHVIYYDLSYRFLQKLVGGEIKDSGVR